MEWTRSPLMRTIAMTASVALILIHWDERGTWFWVGVALVVLNVTGILLTRSRAVRDDERFAGSRSPASHGDDRHSYALEELLNSPGVVAAFAAGPQQWHQVSYLEDTQFEPTTAEGLAAYVWLERDEGWAIGLGDEVKPYVDLDLDEADDPLIRVLKAHPAVEDAFHEDREVYRIEQRHPISTEEFAALAAQALVSHHVHAAARS